jgi:hypothetical protein
MWSWTLVVCGVISVIIAVFKVWRDAEKNRIKKGGLLPDIVLIVIGLITITGGIFKTHDDSRQKLATRKIEEQLAPRHLSDIARQKLNVNLLALKGDSIVIRTAVIGNDEVRQFTLELAQAFQIAGLQVQYSLVNMVVGDVPLAGLSLTVGAGRTDDADIVEQALTSAGLLEKPLRRFPSKPGYLVITVGPK